MKKKPFILLEILLAFSLVLIAIIPLVKQPLYLYKEEVLNLEKLELERMADWAFTEAKEILLKNEIPWEKIPSKHETTGPFFLPPITLDIPGIPKRQIERNFTLYGRGEKAGANNKLYRQLGIYIHLEKKSYAFRLPVEKS